MSRATKADKTQRVNAAFRLLQQQTELREAAETLVREFALSRRQAYRYLEQAGALRVPVPTVEPTVAVTFKLPVRTVRALRAAARRRGLPLGQAVTQALTAWFRAVSPRG